MHVRGGGIGAAHEGRSPSHCSCACCRQPHLLTCSPQAPADSTSACGLNVNLNSCHAGARSDFAINLERLQYRWRPRLGCTVPAVPSPPAEPALPASKRVCAANWRAASLPVFLPARPPPCPPACALLQLPQPAAAVPQRAVRRLRLELQRHPQPAAARGAAAGLPAASRVPGVRGEGRQCSLLRFPACSDRA